MSTTQNPATVVDNRWHQQPAMWVVFGILGFSVVSSFVLLFIAVRNPPDVIDKAPVRIEAPERR
ncbi:MAG: hypothetical protein KJP03_06810 [Gammaproteobacteria bacterium]|nr:hypothetical protein [Gammaproteobacteria bacterium]